MERKEFGTHVSASYNQYLEDLFNLVLEMGGMVEKQLSSAVIAVQNADVGLAKEVIQLDKFINREEIEIDRLCARVLARQQPTASDLRLVISAIRIALDLERMGDEVVKIAKLVVHLDKIGSDACLNLQGYKELIEISAHGTDMLKDALNAFSRLDLPSCAAIIQEEEKVDVIYKRAVKEVTERFKDSESDIECLLELIYALKASERITDHACNIAEIIVYLVNGKELRNMDSERMAEMLNELTRS
ncbi:phosphate signaling complex protein PhoU [Thiomicrospira sp.]|uniref:phosphate signaling complex protein PhoU n=1 Tax=Thiomicrospira sp. TaxID=935 RepID=UPI002F94E043